MSNYILGDATKITLAMRRVANQCQRHPVPWPRYVVPRPRRKADVITDAPAIGSAAIVIPADYSAAQ